jgi:hypothetical protein
MRSMVEGASASTDFDAEAVQSPSPNDSGTEGQTASCVPLPNEGRGVERVKFPGKRSYFLRSLDIRSISVIVVPMEAG